MSASFGDRFSCFDYLAARAIRVHLTRECCVHTLLRNSQRLGTRMTLFNPIKLELFAAEQGMSRASATRGLLALRKLMARRLDGFLGTLTETRVEQSFNERVFADVFGY